MVFKFLHSNSTFPFVLYVLGMQGLEAFCHSDPEAKSLHVVATTEANLRQGGRITAIICEDAVTLHKLTSVLHCKLEFVKARPA